MSAELVVSRLAAIACMASRKLPDPSYPEVGNPDQASVQSQEPQEAQSESEEPMTALNANPTANDREDKPDQECEVPGHTSLNRLDWSQGCWVPLCPPRVEKEVGASIVFQGSGVFEQPRS